MAAQKIPLFTPQEYLDGERLAVTKSEYIAGEIIAMAGASPEHSAIATDTRWILRTALDAANSDCEVYDSDLRVRLNEAGPFFYPDITVVCGEPQFDYDDCLRNPTVLIEVLSDSTASQDRGVKFFHYRHFSSLRHYVLVEQGQVLVEHWERAQNGLWTLTAEHTDIAESVALSALRIKLPLTEIYRRVSFATPASP
jgi:Uma2 family endonuclease